jgi:hypothetical protein
MKLKLTLASVALVAVLAAGFIPATTTAVEAQTFATGASILIITPFPSISNFDTNYTYAGNDVTITSTVDYTTFGDYDIIMTQLDDGIVMNSTELTALKTWFDSGDKMFFLGGDDDYGGDDVTDNNNLVLKTLGTSLRLDYSGLNDLQSNDQAAYRVLGNETGVSSPLTDAATARFTQMIFHGPGAFVWDDAGTIKDLRNATLGAGALTNVDIIVNSSKAAFAVDNTINVTALDKAFYVQSSVTGLYPLLVADTIGTSLLVASAEASFDDYKNMYGTTTEKGDVHTGAYVMDDLISYYWTTMASGSTVDLVVETETENETETETLTEVESVTDTIFSTVNNTETATVDVTNEVTVDVTNEVDVTNVVTNVVTETVDVTQTKSEAGMGTLAVISFVAIVTAAAAIVRRRH